MTTRTLKSLAVTLLALTPLALCSCSHDPTTESSAGKPAGWHGRTMKLPKAGDPPQPPAPAGTQGAP